MKNVLIFLSLVCITLEQGFNQGFPYRQNINNPFGQNQRNQIPQQYSYEQNQRNQIPQQYSYGQNPQNLNNAQNQKIKTKEIKFLNNILMDKILKILIMLKIKKIKTNIFNKIIIIFNLEIDKIMLIIQIII